MYAVEIWGYFQAKGLTVYGIAGLMGNLYAESGLNPWKELTESYPGVLAVLKSATSVLEASNAVLLNFEKPASKDTIETQTRRAGYGQMYYDQFVTQQEELSLVEFKELYRVMRSELQDNDAGEWSAEARQWAVGHGLVAGSGTKINGQPNYMWQDLLTREQLVTMLYRFAEMMR